MINLDEENKKLKEALYLSRTLGDKENIGVQGEHTLHRVLKFYISNNLENHEIKIGRRFADVMLDKTIYEVQTKAFNLLKEKLICFLKDYEVVVVHPIASSTHYFLTNEYGELIKDRKSPKHLNIFYAFSKISDFCA